MSWSFSQLSTYRRCPRQYEYASVKKIPRVISREEAFGAAIHNALKKWGELEIRRGQKTVDSGQIPLFLNEEASADHSSLTTDHLLHIWHGCVAVDAYATKMEADYARNQGEIILRQFFAWWATEPRNVIAVERGFSVQIDNQAYAGRFDRIERTERGLSIIDFKTSAPRTQEETDADLQLSLYALACPETFGEPCAELSFLFIGEEGVIERRTARSPGQLQDARTQILSLTERITSGDYHPTPSAAVCRRCPYRSVCDVAAA